MPPPTCGASNVSFGLPNRNGINAAFLTMAIGAGLGALFGKGGMGAAMPGLGGGMGGGSLPGLGGGGGAPDLSNFLKK